MLKKYFDKHADSIGSSQWNESRASDHPPARTDDASIQNLEKILINYFHEEGRGNNCKVDCYKRGKLNYFFAYPEDYAKASIEWDGAVTFMLFSTLVGN